MRGITGIGAIHNQVLCCAGCCTTFPAPTLPEAALPWDLLTVQHTANNYILRRCCLVTVPLGDEFGGYSAGATIPYYQPADVGPPLTANGDYSINVPNAYSLTLGNHPENEVEGATVDPDGERKLSAADEFGDPVWYHRPQSDPLDGTTWHGGDNGWQSPSWVRLTQATPDGQQFAIYQNHGRQNGELSEGTAERFAVFDLVTGEGYAFWPTLMGLDAHNTQWRAAMGFAFGSGPVVASDNSGQEVCVGPNGIGRILRVDTSGDFTVADYFFPFDRSSVPGAWVTSSTTVVQSYSWETGIHKLAYQWDNTDYYLECERLPAENRQRIYRNGPQGRKLLMSDAPLDSVPFCYQRRGTRHMFLLGDVLGYGSILVDIDECGSQTVAQRTTIDTDDGLFCNIGPEGEQLLITQTKVARLGDGGWELTATDLPANPSIVRQTWYGSYQVRGFAYEHAGSFRGPGEYANPWHRKDLSPAGDLSYAFAIHRDGPSAGVLVGRQMAVDSSYNSATDLSPWTGSEIIHFAGEDFTEFTSMNDLRDATGVSWALNIYAGYHCGVTAAPAPSHYGPGVASLSGV